MKKYKTEKEGRALELKGMYKRLADARHSNFLELEKYILNQIKKFTKKREDKGSIYPAL